jgi:hypothetical protein
MDATGTYPADDNLESEQEMETGTSSNIDEHSVLAARGDIDSKVTKLANFTESEDTPLLEESRSSSHTQREDVRELEGLPWHKRPSVSLRYLLVL